MQRGKIARAEVAAKKAAFQAAKKAETAAEADLADAALALKPVKQQQVDDAVDEASRKFVVVLDLDETLIGLTGDLHHRCVLAEGWQAESVAMESPSIEALVEALNKGLLRPAVANMLQLFSQELQLPVVIYTKASPDWAAVLVQAIEQVVGFQFLIPDGLFHREDCDKRVTGPDGAVSKHDKTLGCVVERLQVRPGLEWVTVEKMLMFDDLNTLPPWEQQQLVHVKPYRWTDTSGVLNDDEMNSLEKEDEDGYEIVANYLQEEGLRSVADIPEDELYYGCRQLINELNPQLFEQDNLWMCVIMFFKQPGSSCIQRVHLICSYCVGARCIGRGNWWRDSCGIVATSLGSNSAGGPGNQGSDCNAGWRRACRRKWSSLHNRRR